MAKASKPAVVRLFKGSIDEMITALSLVFGVVIEQKSALEAEFPLWASPFLDNIKLQLENGDRKSVV